MYLTMRFISCVSVQRKISCQLPQIWTQPPPPPPIRWSVAPQKFSDIKTRSWATVLSYKAKRAFRMALISSADMLIPFLFCPIPKCCRLLIDREPRGVNLAGKVTNFHTYHGVGHGSKCKKLNVCRSSSGGCGQRRSFSNSPYEKYHSLQFCSFFKIRIERQD